MGPRHGAAAVTGTARRRTGAVGRVLAALVMALVATPQAAAQDDTDAHLWTQVVATLQPTDDWRVHLELQPRWFDNVTASFQVLGRAAVGRRVHDRTAVWGGYAVVAKPPGPGTAYEQRVWQQLTTSAAPRAGWTPSLRLRLEQRTQAGWDNWSHRGRVLARANRALSKNWSLGLWNETFVTFDRTARGPKQGFDQNRLATMMMRRLATGVGLETGYVWVAHETSPGRVLNNHVWLTSLSVTR